MTSSSLGATPIACQDPAPASTFGEALVTAGALLEMTKYRLSSLVGLTSAAGFLLAAGPLPLDWALFAWATVGTLLSSFGACALNQCLEAPLDQQMARTRGRPLPSGRVSLRLGVAWSAGLLAAGVGLLAAGVGWLPAALALLVGVLYVALYTPLKQRTSINTLIGAVCGAIPPMIGWSAVTGGLEPGAWVLFGILFLWQIPHFLAIDWFYRDDYRQGGFCMPSSVDPSGRFSGHHAVIYGLALLPVSALAPAAGLGGWLYLVGALVLGTAFFGLSVLLWVTRSREAARRLFLGSLAYLPLLLGLLVLDPTA